MKVFFSIGEASEFFGISAALLRHYEREGLLSPSSVGANRYRQDAFTGLLKLNDVRVLRALDFGLGEIATFVDERNLDGHDSMLAAKVVEVEAQLRREAQVENHRTRLKRYDSFDFP
jgi:DNA-binding transcriptional MerR regulator